MSTKSKSKPAENGSLIDPSEYMADVSTRLASGVLGLMGFVTALLVGLFAGNPVIVILLRAILAMFICSIIGRMLGSVGEICVREFVTKYKSDRPQPIKPKELVDLDKEQQDHETVVKTMKKAA